MSLYGPNGQMLSSYTGDGCETLLCPNACSGHGTCVTANARGCVCVAGYKGTHSSARARGTRRHRTSHAPCRCMLHAAPGNDCGVPSTVPMWQMDVLPSTSAARASAAGAYSSTYDAVGQTPTRVTGSRVCAYV